MEVSPLIVNIVRYTAKLIAAFAVHKKRARIAHVEPQMFLELDRGLRQAGVGESAAAEMMGLSYQTLRARIPVYEEDYKQCIASPSIAWLRVVCFLRKHAQYCSSEEIVAQHGSFDGRLIRGILKELENLGWVEATGGQRTRRLYRWQGGPELGQRATVALVRQHIFQFGPTPKEAIQDALAIDEKQLNEILNILCTGGEVVEEGAEDQRLYHCNGLDLGPPSLETLDAAVLDHFQTMVLALIDKLNCNINPDLPPVGGSTFTLELWPGHPFETRVRDIFERYRKDLSQLRQEMQDVKHILKEAGKEPPRSKWYTLKMYVGQHVLGSHNLCHVQEYSTDETKTENKHQGIPTASSKNK